MKKLDGLNTESFPIHLLDIELLTRLYEFTNKSFHLANQEEFNLLVIQAEKKGDITVLFGERNEIAGFSRTYNQSMSLGKKSIILYITSIYLSPYYKPSSTITNAGLTHAIEYKLANPQEELIYVALANNPAAYEFFYNLSDFLYPKPSLTVPDQILAVVNALKKQEGWISTGKHPMVINSPLVPLRSQVQHLNYQDNEINDFFVQTNPDYMQGNSIMVYIPLHLANINYGLNHELINPQLKNQFHINPTPLRKMQ